LADLATSVDWLMSDLRKAKSRALAPGFFAAGQPTSAPAAVTSRPGHCPAMGSDVRKCRNPVGTCRRKCSTFPFAVLSPSPL
jgi:hypothetical protein